MVEYKLIKFSRKAPAAPLPLDFTLNAQPHTDVWRKPPSTDVLNALILYRRISLSSFRRARVTITADWKTVYDQGGIILVALQPDGSEKWVKTGIEFYGKRAKCQHCGCRSMGGLVPAPTVEVWVWKDGDN
jgi:hypothetical protein